MSFSPNPQSPNQRRSSRKSEKLFRRRNPTQARVLELLAEFFCNRVSDAVGLLKDQELPASNERSLRRILAGLHAEGLVERLAYLNPLQERGGVTYVYGLSDKGVEDAYRNGYCTTSTKSFDEHSRRTLDHELEITNFHILLHRFCAANGLKYTWRQIDLKHTIHPDALFTIEDPRDPEKEFCYFLEIERSKFGNYLNGEPQIVRKLGAFYEYFNSTDCEKEWGFRQFRVVVVQRTDARRDGLIEALQEKYRHKMFWLTTEAAYRQDIGAEIFKTPKDHKDRSYSFLAVP